jgi:Kyakuja-Dileera-Zisupton transposase
VVADLIDEDVCGLLNATTCTVNWKAVQDNHRKAAHQQWEETGIFAAVCRHGIVALVVDMRRSGEL